MANSPLSGGLVIRSPQQAAEEDAANRAAGLPDVQVPAIGVQPPAVTIEPAPPEPEPAASVPAGAPPPQRETPPEMLAPVPPPAGGGGARRGIPAGRRAGRRGELGSVTCAGASWLPRESATTILCVALPATSFRTDDWPAPAAKK